MKVYVVEMLRYGERELHSYVIGVFPTRTLAEKEGEEEEREFRGGKYEAEILEFELDLPIDTKL